MTINIKYIDVFGIRDGTPADNDILTIHSDYFTGDSLGSATRAGADFPATTPNWVRFTFSPIVTISANITYYITLEREGDDEDNVTGWRYNGNLYPNGNGYTRRATGWYNNLYDWDTTFRIYDDTTTLIASQDTDGGYARWILGGTGNAQACGQVFLIEGSVSDIKTLINVAQANINKIEGVANADAKKIMGVTNVN